VGSTPYFTQAPNAGAASITTVNTTTGTAADGTSNMTTLVTANASYGSFVRSVSVAPRGGNALCCVRLWLNTGGGTRRLLSATQIVATTASTTVPPPTVEIPVFRQLKAGWSLDVNISAAASPLAAAVDVTAFGSDYPAP
jgi:hypothetical protein